MRSLMWFKNDLRMHNNTALYNASTKSESMIALFFITEKLWRKNGYGDIKIDFILRNINELSCLLQTKNIPLLIKQANNYQEIQKELLQIALQNKIDALYFNNSSNDINYRKEIDKITKIFIKHKKQVFSYNDETIIAPGLVLTKQQQPYSIYTPFKNQWMNIFDKKNDLVLMGTPKKQQNILCKSTPIKSISTIKIDSCIKNIWPAGETVAKRNLKNFIKNNIKQYNNGRDYPAQDKTSRLSPYLACGVISAQECLEEALKANNNRLNTGDKGITTWISELIWRDFYKHLLYAFPYLNKHQPFKQYTNNIIWNKDKKLFKKWQNGETGFPIIDAAMNQLNQTGWMHNRLRMIAASFLTKLLFIDWRWGEAYFAEKLIDYDFAANNGGWQWSASTGADSVPYFRIFNPTLQQNKYDPTGEFIKLYSDTTTIDKLQPIIDYKKARNKALNAFKKTK